MLEQIVMLEMEVGIEEKVGWMWGERVIGIGLEEDEMNGEGFLALGWRA